MSRKERANPFSINSLLKFACIFLGILLVIYFVKTQLDMIEMQEQLVEMQQQVELQRLRNKDAELSLREDDEIIGARRPGEAGLRPSRRADLR